MISIPVDDLRLKYRDHAKFHAWCELRTIDDFLLLGSQRLRTELKDILWFTDDATVYLDIASIFDQLTHLSKREIYTSYLQGKHERSLTTFLQSRPVFSERLCRSLPLT